MVRLHWVLHRGVFLAGDCIFKKSVFMSVVRLRWVKYRGVSRAGDCIFKKISVFWTVIRLHWVLYRGVSRAGDCIFKKSLSSGLWHDYAGSYSVVFPLLVTVSLKNPSVLDCGTTTAWCFPCW